MTRSVVFAPEAQEDLLQLYDYIAADSDAERARGNTDRIVATCIGLETFPERGTRRAICGPACAPQPSAAAAPLRLISPPRQ